MTLKSIKDQIPPVSKLTYKKGELIIKENDFGISIYTIVSGKVQIFSQPDNKDVTLAILGPGQFIGEMAFLRKDFGVRSASARAVEDVELEVWHPDHISEEYDQMPPIIKHMTDEVQKRLLRLNKFIVQMSMEEVEEEEEEEEEQAFDDRKEKAVRRAHYRKDVNLACVYRPVDAPPSLYLNGSIKNISLTGINLEARATTAAKFSHDPGDEFYIELTLPNSKGIQVTARVQALRKPRVPGSISLGMVFTSMKEGAQKALGFFLMP